MAGQYNEREAMAIVERLGVQAGIHARIATEAKKELGKSTVALGDARSKVDKLRQQVVELTALVKDIRDQNALNHAPDLKQRVIDLVGEAG